MKIYFSLILSVFIFSSMSFARGPGESRALAARQGNASHNFASNCEADPLTLAYKVQGLATAIREKRESNANTRDFLQKEIRDAYGGISVNQAQANQNAINEIDQRESEREDAVRCSEESLHVNFLREYGGKCADIGAIRNGVCAERSYDGNTDELYQRASSGAADLLRAAKAEFERFAAELNIRNNSCSSAMGEEVLRNETCNNLLDSVFNVDSYSDDCSLESIQGAVRRIGNTLTDRAYVICTIYDDQLQHRRSQRAFENKAIEVERTIACLEGRDNCPSTPQE